MNVLRIIPVYCFVLIFFSCSTNSPKEKTIKANKDSAISKSIPHIPSVHELDSSEKTLGPVFGYRFVISGDFDGDGKRETLTEHFFSKKMNRESYKFYDSLDYDHLVGFTTYKDPFSFLICDNKKIDTLIISDFGQLLGLSFLKNEGDLNGDGNDEISYVINWGDWSNCNTCHIVTYKNKKWKEIYSFDIWDSQFPDLPQTSNQYYLFGLNDKLIKSNENYFEKTRKENDLKNFSGLIKKMKNGKTRIIYRGPDAELDTLFIRLK